jgi:hypothetical protein
MVGANVESKLLQLEQIVRANYWSKGNGQSELLQSGQTGRANYWSKAYG